MTITKSDVASGGTGPSPTEQATRALASGTVDDTLAAAGELAATLAPGADRHDREGSYAAGNIAAIWDAGLGSLLLAADIDAGGSQAATAASVTGLTKVVVTDSVIRALEAGLRLIGNPGLSYHHPLQRHYRNALCSRIHTPQDDVVLTAAGRAVLQRAAATS
jgi:alkylation response protein AidB-like acyl-CoA dehydrogenase